MNQILLKNLHMGLALLSIGGFILRFTWKQTGHGLFEHRLTRVLPHVVDTFFLAAGIGLAINIAQYPFREPWLTAKVFGLLAYIVLGSFALKRAQSARVQYIAFVCALFSFAWIGSVARSRDAWGFFSALF